MAVHRIYIDGTWYLLPIPEKADTSEATGATDDNKFMTPKKTKQLIDSLDLGAISEVVTTGSGNAVTNITVSSDGKTLTATKGSTFSLTDHKHSLDGSTITGVLPISKGGTGATSASAARTALGLGNIATKNLSSNFDWVGEHSFSEPIKFTPNVGTYYIGAPGVGSGTVNLPLDKSGTIALTSDLTWNKITGKPTTFNPSSHRHSTSDLDEPTYTKSNVPITAQPYFDVLRADRLAFLPADQIIIEQSTDAGVTWTDAGITDNYKKRLFDSSRPGSIKIPLKNGVRSTDCMLRITITGMKYNVPPSTPETEKYNYWTSANVTQSERYCSLEKCYMDLSSITDNIYVKIQKAKGSTPNNWEDVVEAIFAGWSGSNYCTIPYTTFGGATNQTSNYWNFRFIFRTCATDGSFDDAKLSPTSPNSQQNIIQIKATGRNIWTVPNNMAYMDKLYTWDSDQNATFPNGLSSKGLLKSDTNIQAAGSITAKKLKVNYNSGLEQIEVVGNSGNISMLRVSSGKLVLKNNSDSNYSPIATEAYVTNNTRSSSWVPTASEISGLGSLALKSSLTPDDIPTLPYTKIAFPQAPGDLLMTSPQGGLGTISQANLLSGLALSTHSHGNITNDGRIGSTANRVIVTDTNGKLIAKAAGTTSQFLRGDGLWATPPTVDTTQDYTWTGKHTFDMSPGNTNAIEFKTSSGALPKFTATIDVGQEGTYPMEWTLPTASGTVALTSDIPDVIYGYCSTSASTTAKVVSSNTFTSHKAGQIYVIEFVNGNTATSPTININSTGAIGVRHLTTNGAVTTSPGTDIMYARSRTIWTFVYNGTYLIPIGESTRYWNALETKMLGYSKGSSSSAISTSDTVSSAIGKLEYRLDNLSISNISGLQTALNAKVDKASFSLSGTTLTITV